MLGPNVTEAEKLCIRILARIFESGEVNVIDPQAVLAKNGLELERPQFETLMRTLQGYGAFLDVAHNVRKGWFDQVILDAGILQAARELDRRDAEAARPGDIVAEIQEKARRHGILAWAIIGFVVLTTALTFVNQLVQLLKTLGLMHDAARP